MGFGTNRDSDHDGGALGDGAGEDRSPGWIVEVILELGPIGLPGSGREGNGKVGRRSPRDVADADAGGDHNFETARDTQPERAVVSDTDGHRVSARRRWCPRDIAIDVNG